MSSVIIIVVVLFADLLLVPIFWMNKNINWLDNRKWIKSKNWRHFKKKKNRKILFDFHLIWSIDNELLDFNVKNMSHTNRSYHYSWLLICLLPSSSSVVVIVAVISSIFRLQTVQCVHIIVHMMDKLLQCGSEPIAQMENTYTHRLNGWNMCHK